MTQERVTVTEEVVVAGEVVTQQRETLKLVTEPEEEIARKEAMSVNHPDYVSAQDRVYTYNPETNMSESARRPDPVEEPEPDEEEVEPTDREILQQWIWDEQVSEGGSGYIELDRDYYLDGPVTIPEGMTVTAPAGITLYAVDGNDTLIEGDGTYIENILVAATCNHPIGNGACILEDGHAGQHRLNPE